MSYKVQITNFEGPLDLLLQLIEKEELDITDISLSKITDEFISYINNFKTNTEELAEFLNIAAKLIYIKSKNLLPNPQEEEEQEIEDLKQKLEEYKKYKEVALHLGMVLNKNLRAYSRNSTSKIKVKTFVPPKEVDLEGLLKIFKETVAKMPKEKEDDIKISLEKISIKDKIKEVNNIISKKKTSFSNLLKKSKSKLEVIVTFLAILEMIKQKTVKVAQKKHFSDFTIQRI